MGGAEFHFDEAPLLIHQVRLGQKQSDIFKEAWIQHVKSKGKDVRDPARHSTKFLQDFLAGAPEYTTYSEDPAHMELVNQVKHGQRQSEEFKKQWWAHCSGKGKGVNDPAKHDSSFLRKFLSVRGMGTPNMKHAPLRGKGVGRT